VVIPNPLSRSCPSRRDWLLLILRREYSRQLTHGLPRIIIRKCETDTVDRGGPAKPTVARSGPRHWFKNVTPPERIWLIISVSEPDWLFGKPQIDTPIGFGLVAADFPWARRSWDRIVEDCWHICRQSPQFARCGDKLRIRCRPELPTQRIPSAAYVLEKLHPGLSLIIILKFIEDPAAPVLSPLGFAIACFNGNPKSL